MFVVALGKFCKYATLALLSKLFCLQVLEDIMRSHEDDVEFYKVPPVGKHYSEKWAHEDMLEEQRQGEY